MADFPWEDNLLERKLESDLKDLLKSLVAFANSVKPGHTAVILIGEDDSGTAQGVQNPDHIQNKIRMECGIIQTFCGNLLFMRHMMEINIV